MMNNTNNGCFDETEMGAMGETFLFSEQWTSASEKLKNLKFGFHKLNVPINISPSEFSAILFTPNATRAGIVMDVMRKIHPEDSFWGQSNSSEIETLNKCNQVSKWFGLASKNDCVLGLGCEEQQYYFWMNLLATAHHLSEATLESVMQSSLNMRFAKLVTDLVMADSVLTDTTAPFTKVKKDVNSEKTVDMNPVLDELREFAEIEVEELENLLDDLNSKSFSRMLPTKRLSNASKQCIGKLDALNQYYEQRSLSPTGSFDQQELRSGLAMSSKELQNVTDGLEEIKKSVAASLSNSKLQAQELHSDL